MDYNKIDLATVRALFPTAEISPEGGSGTDAVLDEWLCRGYDIAFYRTTDNALIARAADPAKFHLEEFLVTRHGQARLVFGHFNPRRAHYADDARIQGWAQAEIHQNGSGEYSIDLGDEGGLPGNATSMGALSFRLADETASGIKAEQYARIIEAATAELADYGLVPNSAWRGSGDRFSVELAITDWDLLDDEAETEDVEEED